MTWSSDTHCYPAGDTPLTVSYCGRVVGKRETMEPETEATVRCPACEWRIRLIEQRDLEAREGQ